MKAISPFLFATLAVVLPPACLAQTSHAHPATPAAAKPAAPLPMTNGTVRKVNAERGAVTIAHDDIKNLDMPKMTMEFRVKDPAWAKKLKEGDRIRFAADMVGGELMVVAWEPAN